MSEGLFFPQQVAGSSGSAGSTDYLQDSFQDYSLPATNNTDLSSTILTNPLSDNYNNDLSAKYSFKTLYIKDLVLEQDQSKWFKNQKTYRVVFTEDFPGVHGYVSGNVQVNNTINGKSISLYGFAEFGVNGQIVKASFLVKPSSSSNSNPVGKYIIDNSDTGTNIAVKDFSSEYNGVLDSLNGTFINEQNKYFLADDGGAFQTDDLHDFKFGNSSGAAANVAIEVIGVVVCLSSSASIVRVRGGSSFVDKSLATSANGATFTLPAQNASLFHLGAKSTFYENAAGVIGVTTYQVPLIQSQATGLSGTNSVSVDVGSGASFPLGTGLNIQSGTSLYFGIVRAQSVDTLTVSPTLPYGLSGATLTKTFYVPSTASLTIIDPRNREGVSSAIYDLAYSWDPLSTYGASNWSGSSAFFNINGPTAVTSVTTMPYNTYYDPDNRYAIIPITGASSAQGRMATVESKAGWKGPLAVVGDFQAISFEYQEYSGASGNERLRTTRSTIDGFTLFPSTSFVVQGQTFIPFFAFTPAQDLGIGLHRVDFIPENDATLTNSGIVTKINFYKYKGVSVAGKLHSLEQIQTPAVVSGIATLPQGLYKFFGSDKLTYSGSWFRENQIVGSTMSSYPAFARCVSGATSNAVCTFKYWGQNFALYFDSAGGSFTTTLDGNNISPTSGTINTVATEMIHTLVLSRASGTFGIQGIGIFKNYGELKNEQNFIPYETTATDGKILGRGTAQGPGVVDELSLGTGLTMVNKTINGTDPLSVAKAWVNFNGVIQTGTYQAFGLTAVITITGHGSTVGMQAGVTFTAGNSGIPVGGQFNILAAAANSFMITLGASLGTTGTITMMYYIRDSYNVAGINRTGAGQYTIGFIKPMSTSFYPIMFSYGTDSQNGINGEYGLKTVSQTAASFAIYGGRPASVPNDGSIIAALIFGR